MKSKSGLGSKDGYKEVYINADEDRDTRRIKSMLRKIGAHCRGLGLETQMKGTRIYIGDSLYDGNDPESIPLRFRPTGLVTTWVQPKHGRNRYTRHERKKSAEVPDLSLQHDSNRQQKGAGVMPFYEQETTSGITFCGSRSIFSSLYKCNIEYEGATYHCAEQFFQWLRCKDSDDQDRADRVMKCMDGMEARDIGDSCTDKEDWTTRQIGCMELAHNIKYRQNTMERKALLESGNTPLILASSDKFWGGNASYNSIKYHDQSWTGDNTLGSVLAALRSTLRKEERENEKQQNAEGGAGNPKSQGGD